MGPPLTESPGRCRAFERGQAGSPFGGKHNRLRRETRVLKPGETIYYNSIVPHYVGAAGDEPVEFLAVTYNP